MSDILASRRVFSFFLVHNVMMHLETDGVFDYEKHSRHHFVKQRKNLEG